MRRIAIILLALLPALHAAGQKFPERRIIRSGNRDYLSEKFAEAEITYRRALEKAPASYEATDNLAKSLYKQGRWEEAAGMFAPLAADSLNLPHAPGAFYDQGNALFQQRKFAEAIEAYKSSLRLNPTDAQTKFNLAYAQKMLQDQQGGGGGGGQDQNPQQSPDPRGGEDPQQGDGQPQPADARSAPEGMTRQEAEQLLQAVQMGEDRTREKVEENKGRPVQARGGKNW